MYTYSVTSESTLWEIFYYRVAFILLFIILFSFTIAVSRIEYWEGEVTDTIVVVVVAVVGQTVGSISSRTLAYDCLCTLELCTASMIATS